VIPEVAERGLVERDVDLHALAGSLALEQRGEHAQRGPGARALVDERRAHAHARASRLAGHRDQAAGGLHQGVVAGLAGEWPDAPVGADRAVDHPRVPRTHRLGAEAELLRVARSEALEEDIRSLGEAKDRLPPVAVAQRDPD